MYRIGTCIPGSFILDGKRVFSGNYEVLKKCNDYALECGFDFVETSLGNIMKLSDEEAKKGAETMKFRAVNGFLPKKLYSNYDEMVAYAKKAFARMKVMGIETSVFGSGKARKIIFPRLTGKRKMQMLKDYLATISDFAQENGVTITIEPLKKAETNVINFVGEACDLAREINKPNLRALGDIYHMSLNGDDFSVFKKEEDWVKHIHISEKCRKMPGQVDDGFIKSFFDVIQTTAYDGKISCEAGIGDFKKEVKRAAEVLTPYQKN